MARRARWCLPLALSLAACQAPPFSTQRPAPLAQQPQGMVYQVRAVRDLAIVEHHTDPVPTRQVTLRLEEPSTIGIVRVKTGSVGTPYDIQVSDDGRAWKTVLADQTNMTWATELKTLPLGVTGRYVRLSFHNEAMAPISPDKVSVQGLPGARVEWSAGDFASYGYGSWSGYGGRYGGYGRPTPADGGVGTGTADARAYYPDLTAIAPSSFYVDTVVPGKRYLRFPTAIGNSGPGVLRIRGTVEGDVTRGTQEIVDNRGNVVATRDVGTFEYHPSHGHFHVSYVARYEFRRGDYTGEKLQDGRKISFCMEDSIRFKKDINRISEIPDCSPTLQGITPGFADVYSASLPEQIFDLTDLPSGDYTITIALDPMKKFLETNRDNNFAWVQLHYDAASGKAYRLRDFP